ncbi:MAG: DUF2235 domain-containing protein [Bacteroidota bacterium]
MSKNIVLCFDGTNNTVGNRQTSILRIPGLIHPDDQVVYYDPGVGTLRRTTVFGRPKTTASVLAGLGLGYGIFRNVAEAYRYLMNTYEDDDGIFLLGFSRGAYTARLLAGLIQFCGLLDRGRDNLIPHALDAYTRRVRKNDGKEEPPFKTGGRIRSRFGRLPPIQYAGLFDTVSSLGLTLGREQNPHSDANAVIRTVRHALALDERRSFYRPPLMHPPKIAAAGLPKPAADSILQVWFAGVHSDIGGGYEANDVSRMPLEWILVGAARAGLRLKRNEALAATNVSRPFTENAFPIHDSMGRVWPLAEFVKRYTWNRDRNNWDRSANHGRPRRVPPETAIHQSVLDRGADIASYRPTNIPASPIVAAWDRLAGEPNLL